uniref:Uncharacterized protein n=1 Tax=Plectus sambesii TaxID=2011161 RepID=A0A914W0S1_9BILA
MNALLLRSAANFRPPQCVLPRAISTSAVLSKNMSAKYKGTTKRSRMLTYDMAMRPQHIGVRKAWLTWHTQDLEDFRQTQPYQVAQDEIIRRFIRGLFIDSITRDGEEVSTFELFKNYIRKSNIDRNWAI